MSQAPPLPLLVVKYGGAAMGDEELAASWAGDVVQLGREGWRVLIVHGGGPALTRTIRRMGIETTFVDGHRVTDADTAEVAEMVLSGMVNKRVVCLLNRAGGRALGLSGTDAELLAVSPHRPGGRDIGFVGAVDSVNVEPLVLLLDNGYIPVLSSTASDSQGRPMNVNADSMAGAVAAALGASRLIFLSDVPGVLVGGQLQGVLSASGAAALLASGEAGGGMRPKLEAALKALAGGVPRVGLVDGRVRHILAGEVTAGGGLGTLVVGDGDPILGRP
jgi:acetylglutamate kinase